MQGHRSSRLSAIRSQIKRAMSRIGYANRRMFEVRAGEHLVSPTRKAPRDQSVRRTAVPTR